MVTISKQISTEEETVEIKSELDEISIEQHIILGDIDSMEETSSAGIEIGGVGIDVDTGNEYLNTGLLILIVASLYALKKYIDKRFHIKENDND